MNKAFFCLRIAFITLSLFLNFFNAAVYANLLETSVEAKSKKKQQTLLDYPYNPKVPLEVWNQLQPYFLPYHHPLRAKLDRIFKKRVIASTKAMRKAGFIHPVPQKWTHVIVTKHPKLPGYVIKAYLDDQRDHLNRPEYYFWLLRIRGAQIIDQGIQDHQLGHLFKVPKKWIYPLPEKPNAKRAISRRNFILIAEDMDILDDIDNHNEWRGPRVTPEFLKIFYHFVTTYGLWDCSKPANAPFAKDGRIAFVDTQSFYHWPVGYYKLFNFLTAEMLAYWNHLIATNGAG